MIDKPEIPIKSKHSYTGFKKSSAARKAKKVDLDKVKLKLMTILEREVNHLMDASLSYKLTEEQANDVRGYVKLVTNLLAEESQNVKEQSDAELYFTVNKDPIIK